MRHFKFLLSVLISFVSIAVTAQNKDVQAEAAYYFDSKDYKKAYAYWFVDMKWWDSVPQKK